MKSTSHVRGASFVQYMVGVALAIAIAAGGVAVYRLAIGKGSKCLGERVAGAGAVGGTCDGAAAARESTAAVVMAQLGPSSLDAKCDASGKCTNGACFTADTPVLTPDGERPIGSIVAGDLVIAHDPETGSTSARPVVATKTTLGKPSLRLELRDVAGRSEAISVTAEHPFWVAKRGWIAASDLESDDVVTTPTSTAVVVSLAQRAAIEPVHNLEVEGLHTYFVGHAHVLVHNDCNIASKEAWEYPYRISDADQVLRSAAQLAASWKATLEAQKYTGPSMHAPGYNVELEAARSRARQLENLSATQGMIDTRMAQILLSPTADPAAKRAIAQALAEGKHVASMAMPTSSFGLMTPLSITGSKRDQAMFEQAQQLAWSGQTLRFAFAQYAARSGSPDMKSKAAASLLEAQSLFNPNKAFEIFGAKFQRELERSQKAEADSALKRLARLLYAQELGKDPKWSDSVNKDILARKLGEMWKDPEIKKTLADLHAQTISEVKYSDAYRSHVGMLQSEAFLLRLQLEAPEQAKKTLELEIGKVAAIDSLEAKRLLEGILARQLMRDFHQLELEAQAESVERSIDLHVASLAKHDSALKDVAKTGLKAPADVMKRIAKVLSEQQKALALNRAAEATAAIDKIVEDAAKVGQITVQQKSALSKVFNLIEKSDKNGHASVVATTAALFALGVDVHNGEAFKGWDNAKSYQSVATIAKSVGSAESYAKVGAWLLAAKLPAEGTKFAMVIKFTKWGGPIGDGIAATLDTISAVDNFKKGNNKEAVCDVGAAGCAVATTIAGIAIASGATGPAAPIVMLVGTVGYLGFKGIKWMVTDADEVKLLKEAGVYRDMSGSALAAVHEREIRKYANSCTSDRRHCPGPVGEEARRILDGDKNRYDRDLLFKDLYAPTTGKLRFEAEIIAARGSKFYQQHKAAPGTCNNCH